MDILITGLVVVFACFLIWRLLLNSGPQSRSAAQYQRPSKSPDLNSEMSRLVTACRGDKEKARRLVEFERKRNPNIRTDVAIQNAIDRLEKDRR